MRCPDAAGWSKPTLECGPVMLDLAAQTVSVNGGNVDLTSYEYKVLEYLMMHAGELVSKADLTEHIYQQDFDRDSTVLEVFIGRLRKKLDPTARSSRSRPCAVADTGSRSRVLATELDYGTLTGRWRPGLQIKALAQPELRGCVPADRAAAFAAVATTVGGQPGLIAFLALAGYALDRAFQSTVQSGLRERLHSYALAYANSDFARDGSVIPPYDPPDPRFRRPGSGLYAQIVLPAGGWESDSAQGPQLPDGGMLDPGTQAFEGPLPLTRIDGGKGQFIATGTA